MTASNVERTLAERVRRLESRLADVQRVRTVVRPNMRDLRDANLQKVKDKQVPTYNILTGQWDPVSPNDAPSVCGMVEASVTQTVATGAEPAVVYGGPPRIAAGVTWDGVVNAWTIVTAGRYVPRARTKVNFTADGQYYQHIVRLFNLSFKSLTGNVVTLTSPQPHHVIAGDSVVVDSVGAPYDGTYTVNSAPTPTTFTYTKVNANLAQTATTGRVATRLDDDHPPWLRGAPFTPSESGLVTTYTSRPCQASVGDRFYITFFQSSGAAATIQAHDTWFGIDRTGP